MNHSNKKYKIFYFCYEGFSKLGNINNHIRETVSWMAKFGHEVHFFNPNITNPKFDTKVDIHLIPIINKPLLNWISFDIISFFILLKNILVNHPDFLYFRETSSLVPLIISKLFHIPLIIEINGWVLLELEQTGYSKWKLKYIKFIQKLNFKYADKLIPVSEGLKKLIIKNYNLNPKYIIPVSNGTNPEKFLPIKTKITRQQLDLSIDRPIVGFIGSCYHYHGVQYLINASKYIIKEKPNILFIIAGDGAQRLEWINLTKKLNVNKNFLFPGRIPFDLASLYINCYDICVAPWNTKYLNDIGLSPMKLFDYMSCGKLVICSQIYGINEIIEKYKCAISIDVQNAEKFSKTILYYLNNPQEKIKTEQIARKTILENFTWEITTKNLIDVMDKI